MSQRLQMHFLSAAALGTCVRNCKPTDVPLQCLHPTSGVPLSSFQTLHHEHVAFVTSESSVSNVPLVAVESDSGTRMCFRIFIVPDAALRKLTQKSLAGAIFVPSSLARSFRCDATAPVDVDSFAFRSYLPASFVEIRFNGVLEMPIDEFMEQGVAPFFLDQSRVLVVGETATVHNNECVIMNAEPNDCALLVDDKTRVVIVEAEQEESSIHTVETPWRPLPIADRTTPGTQREPNNAERTGSRPFVSPSTSPEASPTASLRSASPQHTSPMRVKPTVSDSSPVLSTSAIFLSQAKNVSRAGDSTLLSRDTRHDSSQRRIRWPNLTTSPPRHQVKHQIGMTLDLENTVQQAVARWTKLKESFSSTTNQPSNLRTTLVNLMSLMHAARTVQEAHNDVFRYLLESRVAHTMRHCVMVLLSVPASVPMHSVSLALERRGVRVQSVWRASATGHVYVTHTAGCTDAVCALVMSSSASFDGETPRQPLVLQHASVTVITPVHSIVDDLARTAEFEAQRLVSRCLQFHRSVGFSHLLGTWLEELIGFQESTESTLERLGMNPRGSELESVKTLDEILRSANEISLLHHAEGNQTEQPRSVNHLEALRLLENRIDGVLSEASPAYLRLMQNSQKESSSALENLQKAMENARRLGSQLNASDAWQREQRRIVPGASGPTYEDAIHDAERWLEIVARSFRREAESTKLTPERCSEILCAVLREVKVCLVMTEAIAAMYEAIYVKMPPRLFGGMRISLFCDAPNHTPSMENDVERQFRMSSTPLAPLPELSNYLNCTRDATVQQATPSRVLKAVARIQGGSSGWDEVAPEAVAESESFLSLIEAVHERCSDTEGGYESLMISLKGVFPL